MENNARYIECCAAGERSGLYYTCINSFLTADEVAYIVNNSESQVLIFSEEKRAWPSEALKQCPNIKSALVADGPGGGAAILNLDEAVNGCPATPSPTNLSVWRCCIRRARPAGRRAFSDRCRINRPPR